MSNILYNWDSLQHTWNDWVLNYDQHKQARFLNNLGLGIKSWGDMIITLVICLVVVTGIYWGFSWYRERPARPAEHEIIINTLLRKLARHGFKRRPAEGLTEFLRRIQEQDHYEDSQLEQIFQVYNRIKYARGYQKQSIIRRFRQLARSWEFSATTSSRSY